MSDHQGLPIAGYLPQSDDNVAIVNGFKRQEESLLRILDAMASKDGFDKRWLAIGRTSIEQGFMAINRSVFKPARVKLPGDEAAE